MPLTWMRTPFAGSMPLACRWKWLELVIRLAGMTPSAMAVCGP